MAHLHAIRAWLLCVCGALYVSVNCHFRLCHKSNKQHLHTLTHTHTEIHTDSHRNTLQLDLWQLLLLALFAFALNAQ